MCDIKKLCSCGEVPEGVDYWKLEFFYGQLPSWGLLVKTRPEHRKLAKEARDQGARILGPMPMPMFKELYHGIAEPEHLERAIKAEERWLNEHNQFDFDYQPFEGDRLMFYVGGEEIAFSFMKGRWAHYPHQAYSVDDRMNLDACAEDRTARSRAALYFQSRYNSNPNNRKQNNTMSDTDYKKTRIVDRGDLAWGGNPEEGTRIVPENAEPANPKSEGNKTTILGFSKGSVPTGPGATAQPSQDAMTDPVAAWLVIVQGPGKGTSVQVGYGWSTIGREVSNRIVLNFGDASITGEKHARILYDSDDREFKVTHESGINATKVNGKSIDSATILKAGDRIKIGATILRFVPFCGADFDWSTPDEAGTSDEKKA
jgi:hypothetical protein